MSSAFSDLKNVSTEPFPFAGLVGFGSIDTEQTDRLTVHRNRIAIDDGARPCDPLTDRGDRTAKQEHQDRFTKHRAVGLSLHQLRCNEYCAERFCQQPLRCEAR